MRNPTLLWPLTAALLAVGPVGCSPTSREPRLAPQTRPAARPVIRPSSIAAQPAPLRTTAPPRIPVQRLCAPAPAPRPKSAYQRRIIFEYADVPLYAAPELPVAPPAPLPVGPRPMVSVQKRLDALLPSLKACYRHWQWKQPGLAGTVEVRLTVDPWGGVRDVQVGSRAPAPAPARVRACVERALPALRFDQVTPRETRLRFTVVFRPSGQRRPAKAPPAPPAPPRAPRHPWHVAPCLLAADPLPVDRPILPHPTLTVTDFDPVQACLDTVYDEAAKRRARCLSKHGRGGFCMQRVSTSRCRQGRYALAVVLERPDTKTIRKVLLGAAARYRACYRSALRRRPGLAGRIAFWIEIPGGVGLPASVRHEPATLAEPGLVTCLGNALGQVQVPQFFGGTAVRLRLPLALRPGRAPVKRPGP